MTQLQETSQNLQLLIKNRRIEALREITELKRKEFKKTAITNLIVSKEKLTAQLNDGREVSIPLSLLAELEILNSPIKPEQLKKYELWGGGQAVFFPEIDEVLPAWIIIQGLNSC